MNSAENQQSNAGQTSAPGLQATKPVLKGNGWAMAALVLWLLGFIASALSADQLLTSLRCGKAPRTIDCAELVRGGPPQTVFVTLTSFKPNWDGSVFQPDEQGRWISAEVPLVADGETTPHVIARVALAHVAGPLNDQNLKIALSKPELTGLISGRGLGDSSAVLASQNPGMDPASCWVVDLGAHPLDKNLMRLAFVAGLAVFAASIWMFVEKYRPGKPGEQVLEFMSPLVMFFKGLHALGRRLPYSRVTCGAILLPLAVAAIIYGSYLFVRLAAPQTVTQFGTEVLCIVVLQVGVALLVVAGSFLLTEADAAI